MKFVKIAFIVVAIAKVCFAGRLRKEETVCAEGRVYNMYSNRCEANKNTVTQGEKQLDFYNKYKNPTIVDLLPVFKYDDEKKQKTEEKRKN